jgi:uncharacterized membrane protein YsdA (DUF1294 family)
MENQATYIIVLYLLINAIAFATMLVDKIKSTRPGAERISEGMLFFMATAFGSLGVYAGMFAFRHKTRKWYFLLGIPMLIIENSAVVYLVYQYSLGSQ